MKKKCSEYQGFGHLQVDFTNQKVNTILKIQEIKEEFKQNPLDLEEVNQKVQEK